MTRAISPVLAAPLLVGVTVVLATVVGVMAVDFGPSEWQDPRVISADATADGTIELIHESGPVIDVTETSIQISVEGDPLDHQPPVPFVGAKGFRGAPTGAFNPSTDPILETGDRSSLTIAGTNSPELEAGDTVTVSFIKDDSRIAVAETKVQVT